MVAAALIILGLIISFTEKTHLFEAPRTRAKKIIIGILVLSAGVSVWQSLTDGWAQDKAYSTIDSLNGRSKVLSELLDSFKVENRQLHREHQDSLKSYHYNSTEILARYGLKVDTLTNTVKRFDTSIQREVQPTLIVNDEITFHNENGERKIQYSIGAADANVHLVYYFYAVVNFEGNFSAGEMIDTPIVSSGSQNFTTILLKDGPPLNLFYFVDRVAKPTEKFIFTIEFGYKSKGNKMQTPVRKVYFVDSKSATVMSVSSEVFYQVALYLKKYKVWEQFYDL